MQTFVVTGASVNFPSGSVLALDADQTRRRRHALTEPENTDLADLKIDAKAVKAGKLTVLVSRQAVMFKQGETVSVIAAPGVNFDRISEVVPANSEEGEKALAEEKSKRSARSMKRAKGPQLPPAAKKKAEKPEPEPELDESGDGESAESGADEALI